MKELSNIGVIAVSFDAYVVEALDALELDRDWMMIISAGIIDPDCPYRIERDRMLSEVSEEADASKASCEVAVGETTVGPHSTSRLVQIAERRLLLQSWHCTSFTILNGDVVGYRIWHNSPSVPIRFSQGLRIQQNGSVVRLTRGFGNPVVRVDGQRWVHTGGPANFYLRPVDFITYPGVTLHGHYYVSWGHLV